jgi:hypothetical protein
MVVLLGPSGSGKSTLLNILGGLDVPTSRKLAYDGHDLSHPTEEGLTQYRRQHIGFIFQFLTPKGRRSHGVPWGMDSRPRSKSLCGQGPQYCSPDERTLPSGRGLGGLRRDRWESRCPQRGGGASRRPGNRNRGRPIGRRGRHYSSWRLGARGSEGRDFAKSSTRSEIPSVAWNHVIRLHVSQWRSTASPNSLIVPEPTE